MVFLYPCIMDKEHLIFGIRAIIEAIQSGAAVDKVFI
jgi:23S rRNA (guanosine2251-2'-O)-methyltransferase